MDSAKMRLWAELKADDGQDSCPISGFTNAYPVKVIRKTDKKTEYTIEIGRKTIDIKEEEAEKLLELPRLPEQLYRYTRYQLEATLVFLEQYDEEHGMEVCKEPDFKEAVEKLKGELPADDTSHFDLANASGKDSSKDEVTIDSLYAEYDNIIDQELTEKSEEYQELREKIRQFIEDKNLDVRISRTKNNVQLLEEIEEALETEQNKPKEEPKPAPAPAPASCRRAPKPKQEEPEISEEDDEAPEQDESEDEAPEAPAAPAAVPASARRVRRARPGSEVDTAPEPETDPEDDGSEEEAPAAPLPPRRTRERRLR